MNARRPTYVTKTPSVATLMGLSRVPANEDSPETDHFVLVIASLSNHADDDADKMVRNMHI